MANILYATPRPSTLWPLGFEEYASNKLAKPNAKSSVTILLSDTDVISYHDDNVIAHVGAFCPLGGAVSAKIFRRQSTV